VLDTDKDLNPTGIGFYLGSMQLSSIIYAVHGQNIQNPVPGMLKPLRMMTYLHQLAGRILSVNTII